MSILDSFNKVMVDNFFVHKGVVIERLVGGFRVLSQKVRTLDEVDAVINGTYKIVNDSIKTPCVETSGVKNN